MPAYRPGRALPAHVTIPNWDSFQVRISRDGVEHSASFAWNAYSDQRAALAAAVQWRDARLAELPPAENLKGSTRTKPLKHKTTWGQVGVTRYFRTDARKQGKPLYLTFGVNWIDHTGRRRTKSFQVGRDTEISWQDELHAANTAEAFRLEFEYCLKSGVVFNPDKYKLWRKHPCYPFIPVPSLLT